MREGRGEDEAEEGKEGVKARKRGKMEVRVNK